MNHTTTNKYHDVDDENKSFDTGVYTLVMRRKALYPMTMLILPNLILAGLTILVFSVPIAAGKVTVFILIYCIYLQFVAILSSLSMLFI